MGRPVTVESLSKQIAREENRVLKLKQQYDDALKNLEDLNEKLEEKKLKHLMEAAKKSGKSYEELLRLIKL